MRFFSPIIFHQLAENCAVKFNFVAKYLFLHLHTYVHTHTVQYIYMYVCLLASVGTQKVRNTIKKLRFNVLHLLFIFMHYKIKI